MIRIRPKVKDIEKVNIFLKPKKYRRNTAASIQVLKLSSILLRVCDFSDSSTKNPVSRHYQQSTPSSPGAA